MNEFTKDELLCLRDCMRMADKSNFSPDDPEWDCSIYGVRDKIQSMIDKYCEHESDGCTYYKSGIKCTDFLDYASSESPCLLKCKKCSELFDDGRP